MYQGGIYTRGSNAYTSWVIIQFGTIIVFKHDSRFCAPIELSKYWNNLKLQRTIAVWKDNRKKCSKSGISMQNETRKINEPKWTCNLL